MGPLVVLLLAALQPLSALDWDLAVSSEGRLDLLNDGHSVITLTFEELYQAKGLVYLPKRDVFLFSNSHPDVETSIYALKVNTTHINSSKIIPLVEAGSKVRNIQSIAHDPKDDVIYWTDSRAGTIFKAALTPKLDRQLKPHAVHKFTEEVPLFIAVDHCKRKMYWTNVNQKHPTVETSLLNGDNRSIVSNDVTSPMGVAVDVRGAGWIYYLDDWDGIKFTVEAVRMDGAEKRTLHSGTHHSPMSLTLDQQALLWTDRAHETVWRMNIGSEEPLKYFGVYDKVPFSIVAKPLSSDFRAVCSMDDASEATTVVPSATALSSLTAAQLCSSPNEKNVSEKCKCENFTSGASPVDLCFNYCLFGTCVVTNGSASCHCPPGREGKRCEVDLCQGLCLNGGSCHLNPLTKKAVCHCSTDFEGQRCEYKKDYCSSLCDASCPACSCDSNNSLSACPPLQSAALSDTFYDPVIITLGCFCGLLTLVAIFLSFKVLQLSRRPRMKRRVIVSRREVNVPSFDQPAAPGGVQAPGSDTCEIMIENCCNMNICETPCFEPPNRLGRKMKKEDKKTLLANMEDSDVEEQEPSDS